MPVPEILEVRSPSFKDEEVKVSKQLWLRGSFHGEEAAPNNSGPGCMQEWRKYYTGSKKTPSTQISAVNPHFLFIITIILICLFIA